MLDVLIRSKTRARLLELLAKEPGRRHYLRGLERELGEPATPIRRELLRLEHLGLLTAADEGNIRYYSVNAQSPLYTQLVAACGVSRPETPTTPTPVLPATVPVAAPGTVRPAPVRPVAIVAAVIAASLVLNLAIAAVVGRRLARAHQDQALTSSAREMYHATPVMHSAQQRASYVESRSPRFRMVPGTW